MEPTIEKLLREYREACRLLRAARSVKREREEALKGSRRVIEERNVAVLHAERALWDYINEEDG